MATQPKMETKSDKNTGTAELDITENEESTIKKNLKQFRDYIQNCVKTPDLIGYFNAFTKAQQEHFLRTDEKNPAEATRLAFKAIDEISGMTGKYTRLVEALKAAGYPKVVKILKGQIIQSNDCNRKKIQSSISQICERLQPKDVLPRLYSWEVISSADVEKISSKADKESTQNAVLELILALPNRSREWYGCFIRALIETGQAELAEVIDKDFAERLKEGSVERGSNLSTEEVPQDAMLVYEREITSSESQIATNQADTDFGIDKQGAQNQIFNTDSDDDTNRIFEMIKQIYETAKVIVQNIASGNKLVLRRIVKAVNVSEMLTSLSSIVPDLSAVKQVVQSMPNNDNETKLKRKTQYNTKPRESKCVLIGNKAKQLRPLIVRSLSDQSLPQITGSTFMPEGEFVICDANNKKIKIFDRDLEYQAELELKGSPCDIAVLSDQKCVVTLPAKKRLQFVKLCPSTEILRSKDMDIMCHGIAAADDKLFVTCYDPETTKADGEVRVLNSLGDTLRRIDCAKLELVRPCSIELNNTADRIYITDFMTSTIKCLSNDGDLIYQHTDVAMKNPTSLFLDGEENVFVCGRWHHNVTAVTSDGENQGTLLNKDDGLNHPLSISFRDFDGILAVSLTDQSEILIFKLSCDTFTRL